MPKKQGTVSLRQLRKEASASLRAARKACTVAFRDARSVARTRCETAKAHELREARAACDAATAAAERVRAAYLTERGPETEAKVRRRAKVRERRELSRRDAIAHVASAYGVPQSVAERAVRRAERRPGLPLDPEQRWRVLADRVTETDIAEAWKAEERAGERQARRAPRPEWNVIVVVDEEFRD